MWAVVSGECHDCGGQVTWIRYIPQHDGWKNGSYFNLVARRNLEDAIKDAKHFSTTHHNCPVRVLCQESTVVWEPEDD